MNQDFPQYEYIWRSNIQKSLSTAFGVDLETQDATGLAVCAKAYLEKIGMSTNERDVQE